MSSWFEIVESGDAIKVQQHLVSNKKQINEVSKVRVVVTKMN